MGVRRRRSRLGDTADVTAARLRRGAHDVLDTVTETTGAQITAVRRDLADRIDPAPVPRRGLRLLVLGLFLTTVSAVVWAVLERRAPGTTAPHGGPEHLPPAADTEGAGPAVTSGADGEPAPGLTGDPEAGTR